VSLKMSGKLPLPLVLTLTSYSYLSYKIIYPPAEHKIAIEKNNNAVHVEWATTTSHVNSMMFAAHSIFEIERTYNQQWKWNPSEAGEGC
jgi:hypothetical protein